MIERRKNNFYNELFSSIFIEGSKEKVEYKLKDSIYQSYIDNGEISKEEIVNIIKDYFQVNNEVFNSKYPDELKDYDRQLEKIISDNYTFYVTDDNLISDNINILRPVVNEITESVYQIIETGKNNSVQKSNNAKNVFGSAMRNILEKVKDNREITSAKNLVTKEEQQEKPRRKKFLEDILREGPKRFDPKSIIERDLKEKDRNKTK